MTRSAEPPVVCAHITVRGRVQGVGFRMFAAQAARQLELRGGVRNLENGWVELEVEGPRGIIEALLKELEIGPPSAQVSKIHTEWRKSTGEFSDFSIWYERHSS